MRTGAQNLCCKRLNMIENVCVELVFYENLGYTNVCVEEKN